MRIEIKEEKEASIAKLDLKKPKEELAGMQKQLEAMKDKDPARKQK